MRYIVTEPVPGGEAYYFVADTESPVYPNFGLVSISEHTPDAGKLAREICDRLNGVRK